MEINDILKKSATMSEAEIRAEIMAGNLPDTDKESALPANLKDLESDLVAALERQKETEARIDEMKAKLIKAMEDNGVKQWKSDSLIITYLEPTTRTIFDSKRFKAEHANVYGLYLKDSVTKGGVRITIRK